MNDMKNLHYIQIKHLGLDNEMMRYIYNFATAVSPDFLESIGIFFFTQEAHFDGRYLFRFHL